MAQNKVITLDYNPQPRQQKMHAARANQILYGGAMGGGKSHAIRWDLYECCLRNPGCVAVLVRQTHPQLLSNHITVCKNEIPGELGRFNESRKRFEFTNGSILYFRHCELDDDLNDFQGMEIHVLGVDEAGLLKPEHLIYIRARVRLGSFVPTQKFPDGTSVLPRIIFGSNPGGPSHAFLKATFIDPAPAEDVFFDKTTADPRDEASKGFRTIFIRATMADNQYLDGSYAGQFSLMREDLIKMYRDGDWDVIPGAFFDCWDRDRHVVLPFKPPEWWTCFRSMDWGMATPFSVGWWCIADGETPVRLRDGSHSLFKKGAMIRYREWYGAATDPITGLAMANKGLKIPPREVAHRILNMSGKERIAYTVGDANMWEVRVGPSAAEQMLRAGLSLRKADRKRVTGWQEMYGRLKNEMLLVTKDCTEFIRTIPMMQAEDDDPEDVKKRHQEDHVADETRYACMSRPYVTTQPEEEPDPFMPKRRTFFDALAQNTRRRRMSG